MNTYLCPECKQEVDINENICQNCGCPITEVLQVENPVEETISKIKTCRTILSVIFSGLIILIIIATVFAFIDETTVYFFPSLMIIVSLLITKFIIDIVLSWMMHMLQTNYYILSELKKTNLNKK